MSSHREQQGFTLIELVVVLVILGILAAFAIPRFVNISTEAREAAVRGLAGSLRSAAALAHGLALARSVSNGTISMEGQNVTIVNGYPSANAAGISATVANLDGFQALADTPAAGSITYRPTNAATAPDRCQVVYTQAAVGGSATVTLTITEADGTSPGCD